MSVSFITPTYNGSRFLGRTIDSVLAQTYSDWEHVIIDDGSTDDSGAIAEFYACRDPRIKSIKIDNHGVANARNYGYSQTAPQSKFVMFLDQDDTLLPTTLEKLVSVLEADPSAVAAHGLSRQADIDDRPSGEIKEGTIWNWERRKMSGRNIVTCSRTEPTTFEALICDCAMPTPGVVLIRRTAMEKIRMPDGRYFDQTVAPGDDWDAWIRLSLHGYFLFLDEVVLNWRIHDANVSNNESKMLRAELTVRNKMRQLPELNPEQRALANWRFASRCGSAMRSRSKQKLCEAKELMEAGDWTNARARAMESVRAYKKYLALKTGGSDKFDIAVF
jgi:glycosyltransferase involved in cell wall biosynthesis